jgi:hypothetical protein
VVTSIPFALLVCDEDVSLLSLIIAVQCWEHQLVEFFQFENIIVLAVVLSWA